MIPRVIDIASLYFERWPQLRTPQALVCPKRPQTGLIDAGAEYAKIVAQLRDGRFRLRLPAGASVQSLLSLAGPMPVGAGYSMEGILEHGDLLWIDPAAAATDGDLVLIHPTDDDVASNAELMSSDSVSAATYDGAGNLMVKLLRFFGREPYVLFTTRRGGTLRPAMRKLSDAGRAWGMVLGPVRRWTRDGQAIGC